MRPAPTKAVIPAAGLGTRFLPATKAQPKEMLPIVDTPAIQYVVQEALAAGLTDILIIVSRGKHAIIDHFDRAFELETTLRERGKEEELRQVETVSGLANIHFVRQKEPLGLGHAVLHARDHVGDAPFCVLLGDDLVSDDPPCLKGLIAAYCATGLGCIAVEELPEEDLPTKGVVAIEEIGKLGREAFHAAGFTSTEGYFQLTGLVEKPAPGTAPSNLGILGRYCLPGAIFPLLERTPPGRGGEVQLTDALVALQRQQGLLGYRYPGKRWDTGNRLGFLEATIDFALRRPDLRQPFLELLRRTLEHEA